MRKRPQTSGAPVESGLGTESLLFGPDGAARAQAVVVPDASQIPEQLAELAEGGGGPVALHLAQAGCRVLVPTTIDRGLTRNLTPREFLYRSAVVLGRRLIGYEVQKVPAGIDGFTSASPEAAGPRRDRVVRRPPHDRGRGDTRLPLESW